MTAEPRAPAPRSLSIALRLTLWYALFTFTLVFVTAGLLYFTVVNSLYEEDLRDLADNLNNARLLLRSVPPGAALPPLQERPSWAPPQQPQIYLRVLDSQGRTLTETPGMGRELAPPASAELAAIASAEGSGGSTGRGTEGSRRDVLSRSGKPYLMLLVRVREQGTLDAPLFMQVAMDRQHDEALLGQYRERLWLVVGAALLCCCVAGYLIARTGLRPIANISRTARHIRSATLHERIGMQGLPAELRELADSFNHMLDRLEESFKHVSQFSDDVAHELRTPINNLRGEIEVALGKARSGEAYREVLGSCLEECTRISRLIQTLLFLARSDTTTQLLQREQIDVSAELSKVEAFYGAAATDAGIELRTTGAAGLSASVNRTLLQQALGNLVSNAIEHTPAGGAITLAAHADPGALRLCVSDTGCGIPAEHLGRVFERFYRVDPARASSAQNVGLGLAVVKSIATRHGGHVEIESEIERGTRVCLVLPQ
ncbi:MAG TPA: heavy metal sensor histidine kinase [Steroidobacteraceae bacterium]|nr:heavy metal sensor histidine kinase [Steroidobacteraceae bacterium]